MKRDIHNYVASLTSPHTCVTSLPCVITGQSYTIYYHILIIYIVLYYIILTLYTQVIYYIITVAGGYILKYYILCSGYPVLKQKVDFKKGGHCVNRTDWTKFFMSTKVS